MVKKLPSHQQVLDEYQRTHKASSFKQFKSVTSKAIFSYRDAMDEDAFMEKAEVEYGNYKPSTMQSRLGHWITYFKIQGLPEEQVTKLRKIIREDFKENIDNEKSKPNPDFTMEEVKKCLYEAYQKETRKDMKILLLFYATCPPLRMVVLDNTIVVRNSVMLRRLKSTDLQDKNFINLETGVFEINQDKTFAREFKIENKEFLEALDKYVSISNWSYLLMMSESTYKRALTDCIGSRPIQTLRHLYISDLVERGVSKQVFQDETRKMGHSFETALREYATHQKSGFFAN